MRAVFFLQGERVPAARARGFALARALSARGVTCDLARRARASTGTRSFPGRSIGRGALYVPFAALARLGQLRDLRQDDVIIFQRPMTELPTVALERWAARGRKTIFDFDDAIFERRWGAAAKFRRLVALVDRVAAGNRHLAAAAAAPDKTVIIPTAVDTERFASTPPAPRARTGGGGRLDGALRQLPAAGPPGGGHRPRARAYGRALRGHLGPAATSLPRGAERGVRPLASRE